MKSFLKYLLLMLYTLALQTVLTVATTALAGPVVWVFMPVILGIFVGIFLLASRRVSFTPNEGLVGGLVFPFFFWTGCITLILLWPEHSPDLGMSVILLFLMGSAAVDLVGILLYALFRGIQLLRQKQSLLPYLVLGGKCIGFSLVFTGLLSVILVCATLAHAILVSPHSNYSLFLALSTLPYTGLVFLFCRPLSNAFKLAGKWILLASSLLPIPVLVAYSVTLTAQKFEQGICYRLLIALLIHCLLILLVLLVLRLGKRDLFSILVSRTPKGKISQRVRFVCLCLGLLCIVVVCYWLLHPTHWRYNDPFVIGNTPNAIEARYGTFDYNSAEYETDDTFTAGYVVDTYETDTYYLIQFRDGVAQQTQCSHLPGG